MGFSITWCAVREEGAQKLLDQLSLSPTGETEEFPESLISAARLDNGWRVIWYNEYDCPFLRPKDLAVISREQDILICLVEEHVMASSAELWSAGKRKWWISHEGENGPKGIETDGDLPESFAPARKAMEEKQRIEGGDNAGVDYIFEIPLLVAQSLVGFKHDEDCPFMTEGEFVVMARTALKKGFFATLLGK